VHAPSITFFTARAFFFAERYKPLILLAILRKDFFRNGRFPPEIYFPVRSKAAFRKAADGTLIQGSGFALVWQGAADGRSPVRHPSLTGKGPIAISSKPLGLPVFGSYDHAFTFRL